MLNKNNKVFVFDIDGVIVDSTEECLIIAWNAYQAYLGKDNLIYSPAEAEPKYARQFRSIRNYVRSMDEYLVVFHSREGEISSQEIFDSKVNSLESNEKINYGKMFFEARKNFKKKDKRAWLKLHNLYPRIREIINRIGLDHKLYVVTGKDKESVVDFLDIMKISITNDKIYDRNAAKDKLAALKLISEKESLPNNSIKFLDDNVTHLVKPFKCGFTVYLASWGYALPEHFKLAKKIGIPIVTPEDLLL